MTVDLALKIPMSRNHLRQTQPTPGCQSKHRDDQHELWNFRSQRKFHDFPFFPDLPTSKRSSMAAIVCSTTETLRLYTMLVPFFSATIRPAFFKMLKCPESVDRANENRSAISPAV